MAEVASTDIIVSEAVIVDNEEDESKVRGLLPHACTLLVKALLSACQLTTITVSGNSSHEAAR
jgi:hypothetical protein